MSEEIHILVEHLRGNVFDITYVMVAAAQSVARENGMKVVGIFLGHQAEELCHDLNVDQVIYMDDPIFADFNPELYIHALEHLYQDKIPRLLMLGHSSLGMDVANGLSSNLGVPLVSQCQTIGQLDEKLLFISQICAGKLMAEGDLPAPSAVLTMMPGVYKPDYGRTEVQPPLLKVSPPKFTASKIECLAYHEPDVGDVDVTKVPVLIAVGRGLTNQDDMEIINELADAMGAEICGSRPLVDLGWMPTSRLIGKSGKSVKPKVYLALGISGAPEHVEGMVDSELIVAINTDPGAPIFDIAHYGVAADLLDFAEVLSDQLQRSKVA